MVDTVVVGMLQGEVRGILLVVVVVGRVAVGSLVVDREQVGIGDIVVVVGRLDLLVDMHFEGSALDMVLVLLDCKQVEDQLCKNKTIVIAIISCNLSTSTCFASLHIFQFPF